MLKEQISNSSYFKRLLDMKAVAELVHMIVQDVDTIDVYNPGSKISPSCFMCHVYRLSVLSNIDNELDLVIDNRKSAVVRAVGFVFLRFVTPPLELWDIFEEYLLDDMELTYNQDGREINTTVGEFVETLMTQDKYFDSPLPRLPVKVKQLVEEKVAPMLQHRKRMQANRTSLTSENAEDMSVEVCMDGAWMKGIAQGFEKRYPSRPKVKVKLENGLDVRAHLGKVIIASGDDQDGEDDGKRGRSRSRSRGRRGGSPDWSRWKGKSDAECLQDLRERQKDSAVTSHGKAYAKRPLNFDASMASTALANPAAEAGVSFSQPSLGRMSRQQEEEEALEEARLARKRREDDERQRQLANVYKKYCATPSQSQGSAYKEVDTPDMLRLG
jgi:pre-mRNA-splicing factor 38B